VCRKGEADFASYSIPLRTDIESELPRSSRHSYKLHYESGRWRCCVGFDRSISSRTTASTSFSPPACLRRLPPRAALSLPTHFLHCRQVGRRCCFKACLTSTKDLTHPLQQLRTVSNVEDLPLPLPRELQIARGTSDVNTLNANPAISSTAFQIFVAMIREIHRVIAVLQAKCKFRFWTGKM
jgi:hypothetical protein